MRTIKVKWDISGKGDEAWGSDFETYDGEVPPKGSYVAKVKRMTLGTIKKEGENKGKPRISVLLELVGGQGSNGLGNKEWQYLGAPIWDGLNIIKAQTGRVNGFLHALTDGSESAKRAVETAFWPPNGPKADKIDRKGQAGGSDVHITQIGKYNIGSPDGECLVRVTTKLGKDLDGNPRAEIQNYIPYDGPKPGYANGTNGTGDYTPDAEDADDGIMDVSDFMDSDEDHVDDGVIISDDGEEPPF